MCQIKAVAVFENQTKNLCRCKTKRWKNSSFVKVARFQTRSLITQLIKLARDGDFGDPPVRYENKIYEGKLSLLPRREN